MATFTVDLLTGNVYLFSGDFTGSGSTPSSGSTYPEVNLFSELPPAASNAGKIYVVRTSSGEYVLNRHEAGLYFSNGILWRRLGDIPSFFLSDNFQIIDSGDNTKGFEFVTSGITSNEFRQIEIQDSDAGELEIVLEPVLEGAVCGEDSLAVIEAVALEVLEPFAALLTGLEGYLHQAAVRAPAGGQFAVRRIHRGIEFKRAVADGALRIEKFRPHVTPLLLCGCDRACRHT